MCYLLTFIFYIAAILSSGEFYKMICLFAIGTGCLIAGVLADLTSAVEKAVINKNTEK